MTTLLSICKETFCRHCCYKLQFKICNTSNFMIFLFFGLNTVFNLIHDVNNYETETPITITIPDFRDILCVKTVHNAFARAKRPGRVFVAVVQELFQETDDDFLTTLLSLEETSATEKEWLENNVTVLTKPAEQARGLHLNQFQAEMLVTRKGFFMHVDSHSDFLLHFDFWLLRVYREVGDEKAVFSNFPLSITKMEEFGFATASTPVFDNSCRRTSFFLPVELETPPEKYRCLLKQGFC